MRIIRIVIKSLVLFFICNILFAIIQPNYPLLSIYNHIIPGRERLPYGENPQLSYSITSNNLSTLFESHVVSRPKADDEYRVFLIGDSGTWGWFLEADQTLAAQINQGEHITPDGKRIMAYNLGYPIMSITKDLLILDYARRYDPDLIIWLVTLESFPPSKQTFPPIVANNPEWMADLITRYDLPMESPTQPDFIDLTIIGQRQELANWLRLQTYGFSWAATGIDQYIPENISTQPFDFADDLTWEGFTADAPFTAADLAFQQLHGVDIPMIIVNEPMYISDDAQHYNIFYPRWAYDHYRELMSNAGWGNYVDLWDAIPPEYFTDSPVHLNSEGTQLFSDRLVTIVMGFLD